MKFHLVESNWHSWFDGFWIFLGQSPDYHEPGWDEVHWQHPSGRQRPPTSCGRGEVVFLLHDPQERQEHGNIGSLQTLEQDHFAIVPDSHPSHSPNLLGFSFDPEQGTCTVQSADQGTGKTKTVLKGTITGNLNAVTLNFRYFGEGLAAMTSEHVRLKQVDAMNPVLVIPEGSPEKYRYIVMPIRQ